jgi:polysaccharide pyruvyl transferase WcaK-like protein
MKTPKILLGGVPFGRNNAGDEAILECIVGIVRSICPAADITVSTDDPEGTGKKLGVKTVPLFGFAPPFSRRQMKRTLKESDLFIWSGATGLSDYPESTVAMLETAQAAGTKTVLFGVGMNDELNPALFTLFPGLRRTVYQAVKCGTLGMLDFVQRSEASKKAQAREKIRQTLSLADLVALRDSESVTALSQCGDIPGVTVGADSALLLEPADLEQIELPEETRRLLNSKIPKIGICVSAQREIQNTEQLVHCFDQWVDDDTRRIVFVPMNPVTDAALMKNLQQEMKHPDRAVVIEGRREPAEILAVASRMDVIASSRLHLLILASIVHVPIIGISRGSKVDNFLRPFGLESAGSVESCCFDRLDREVRRLLNEREAFETTSKAVRETLLNRLDQATGRLRQVIEQL